MLADEKSPAGGNRGLATLDFVVEEFLHPATLETHDVVVMGRVIQLEDRLVRFEVMPAEQPCLFELREHAIDGREPEVEPIGGEGPIDFFRGQVSLLGALEQAENSQSRRGRLESDRLQVLWI